ncbi:pyruvate:ferredoxin oxidoreductase A [Tritrichomonas foetus]|uniref:pyruvate dehydrogenase (NADP(+)) n=1 Tax=Tritrichomonas foetus TaxID=1144522 RepID=A0A1J4KYT3_9EUKA|nr:pyruvate:ferredoxin oxidoreductase A [Tritrichomonas foetus]|eukprot:OHT14860.1 pyruvate:ferredoxin oxidoreductase A [Tritrichomonas foetus]
MIRNASKRIPADGNTAAASIAYQLSETSFIYPITPSTPMGELMDAWIAQGRKNIWGNPVRLTMMQAEGGVAGALHGATATGTVASSFTAAQGLLLMVPDIYKVVHELCPAVIHVASRALANGGMSIFNDHSDIYTCRSSGIPMLCSSTVQETYDLGAIAHLTTIKMGLPFMHFFDGFRTSHEINTYSEVPSEDLIKLVDHEGLMKMRKRSMNPEHPQVRGSILGSEYHWLCAEKPNKLYGSLPFVVEDLMNQLGKITGRYYKPFEYVGHPEAKNVTVLMGSGCGTIEEYVKAHPNEKIGVIKVHLYRPFSVEHLLTVLPKTVEKLCILDKVREFSSPREPLFEDFAAALVGKVNPQFIGGRYGIGSKDFAPNHAEAIYKNLAAPHPVDGFTVGLAGSETALPIGKQTDDLPPGTKQCMFWGLGSDGTVGSNKEAIKIIVDNTNLYGQAYFAYSAHKSGGLTVSHVRFGENPISASYLIQQADYIACHTTAYCQKFDMLKNLKENGIFVLNAPENTNFDELLPPSMKKKLADMNAKFYYVDATKISDECGMPGRINMIMQTAFFGLAGVMPQEKCITLMKKSIEKQYIRKGREVIESNWKMVDKALGAIKEVKYDRQKWAACTPEKVEECTGYNKLLQLSMQQRGDDLTIDEFTDIAAMPPGTSKYEKRGIALRVPEWDSKKCVQCNQCAFLCPHAVIRPFLLTDEEAKGMETIPAKGAQLKGLKFRIQISPYDCTGCGVCNAVCPVKALSMVDPKPKYEPESKNWEQCNAAPNKGHLLEPSNVRNSQFLKPLLEFSGACPGCGEPAIIKLITQLYGDQLYLANAAGCSVVWGSSYPWNPYTTNEHNHGPTWAFSLFEDNAEYGFGMLQSTEYRRFLALNDMQLLMKEDVPESLKKAMQELMDVYNTDESQAASRKVQAELAKIQNPSPLVKDLISQQDCLARKTVWIMGGDGWAYDIDFGGLDHVMASSQNLKCIILDTEVYSNTGGQCSKATQRSAVANFAAAGYAKQKKDLGAMLITYGNVYVASTCALANPEHALKCIREAREYNGPACVINYTPCISHGIKKGMSSLPQHAKELVKSGYLLLYRHDPRRRQEGKNPLQLDSPKPDYNINPLISDESRFASLADIYPKEAETKRPQLVEDLKKRYEYYARMAKQ